MLPVPFGNRSGMLLSLFQGNAMRSPAASLLLLGAIGILAQDCADPKPYGNALDFCSAKAQAMCQIATECHFDQVGCQMYESQVCVTQAVDATTPGTRQYNSDNARACIDALNGAFGNGASQIDFTHIAAFTDACQRVFLGTGGTNQPCNLPYDCSYGLSCMPKTPGGNSFVCAAPQPVQQGQSCAAIGSQCAAETYCAYQQTGAWICAPANGSGQACTDGDGSCSASLHCVAGFCQPRGSAGAPCVQDTDCAPDAPYCDTYANACSVGLTFAPGGVDCMGVAGLSVPRVTPGGGGTGTKDAGSASRD